MWKSAASVALVLVWFLALIGGYWLGGWLHLLLPIALVVFFWGSLRGPTE